MSLPRMSSSLVLVGFLAVALPARGHFLWIEAEKETNKALAVRAGFGEVGAWDPEYAKNIAHAEYWVVGQSDPPTELKMEWSQDQQHYSGVIAKSAESGFAVYGKCVWGLFGTGGTAESLVVYYPKAMLGAPAEWAKRKPFEPAKVELVPVVDGKQVKLTVLVDGKPAEGQTIKFYSESGDKTEAKSDANGGAAFPVSSGLYSVTCVHRLPDKGTHNGQPYEGEMHCATLTFRLP